MTKKCSTRSLAAAASVLLFFAGGSLPPANAATTAAAAAAPTTLLEPTRIKYRDLLVQNNDDANVQASSSMMSALEDALTRVGMVSVTDFPPATVDAIDGMYRSQHACFLDLEQQETSAKRNKNARPRVAAFSDGTVRRTVATQSVSGGLQAIFGTDMDEEDGVAASAPCREFVASSKEVRRAVSTAVRAFARRLSRIVDNVNTAAPDSSEEEGGDAKTTSTPLLKTADGFAFDTLNDVVEYGQALEHFHSYVKNKPSTATSTTATSTIDLHTDQGLFIAFVPGRWGRTGQVADGFYIENEHQEVQQVKFRQGVDTLVFMLGDGINQILNKGPQKGGSSPERDGRRRVPLLRAVPHALRMPSPPPGNDEGDEHTDARVWYGRMVLAPARAVHPAFPNKTFGEIRRGMIAAANDKNRDEGTAAGALRLACSDDTTTSMHRSLEGTECDDPTNELYCWHRCMSLSAHAVSEQICSNERQVLECINPRGQVWSGERHGDYFPACVANNTETETPFPTLPAYPRDEESCTDFEAFVERGCYEHQMVLPAGEGGDGAVFQWTVDAANYAVRARIAYNGLFQYLAAGIANVPGGGLNGMLGANIVMAKAASGYAPDGGLDFATDPDVQQYTIHPEQTSFRFWNTPVAYTTMTDTIAPVDAATVSAQGMEGEGGGDDSTRRRSLHGALLASYESTDCYTALSFYGHMIGDRHLNLTGTDEMLWAANGVDSFMQYHGPNRGRFAVNWAGTDETRTGKTCASAGTTTTVGATAEEESAATNLVTTTARAALWVVGFVSSAAALVL